MKNDRKMREDAGEQGTPEEQRDFIEHEEVAHICDKYGVKPELVHELLDQNSQLQKHRRELGRTMKLGARQESKLLASLNPIADEVLTRMFAVHGNDVWKLGVRSIESKTLRKVLNERLRVRREEHVERTIRERLLSWDGGVVAGVVSFGVGLDERVVELPLAVQLAAFDCGGRILDAGCALNLEYLRPYIAAGTASITHFTQSGEKEICRFEGEKISYQFGDLRDLPYRDETFDRVLCISTLEHVGMDNSRYGGTSEKDYGAYLKALSEMYRVLCHGGFLLVTVPYGSEQDRGWYRVFGRERVAEMRRHLSGSDFDARYFLYNGGWLCCDATEPLLFAEDAPSSEMVRGLTLLLFKKPL